MARAKGINLAESVNKSLIKAASSSNPCIFISHIRVDKSAAISIGNYLTQAGLDIYLDINDPLLQRAVQMNDPQKITQCIETGINMCTHIMCLISNNTVESWWVPYEIGFGKKANKNIASLFLRDSKIPEYLKITQMLRGAKSLNNYLESIMKQKVGKVLLSEEVYKSIPSDGYLVKESSMLHPLNKYLYLDR